MPLYDYECPECGAVREVQHSVNEIGKIQVRCEHCESQMKKMISLPALIGFDEVGRSVGRKDPSTGQEAPKGKEAKAEATKDSAPKKETGKDSKA